MWWDQNRRKRSCSKSFGMINANNTVFTLFCTALFILISFFQPVEPFHWSKIHFQHTISDSVRINTLWKTKSRKIQMNDHDRHINEKSWSKGESRGSFNRRQLLQRSFGSIVLSSFCSSISNRALAESAIASPSGMTNIINLPLQRCGGSFCTVYAVDGQLFRGVLDTGSPFFTVPQSCSKMWGCFKGNWTEAGLDNTIEIYASEEGTVEWRKGLLQIGEFIDPVSGQNSSYGQENLVFGVLPNILVRYPGGVFIGLVKFKEDDIRPTFLGQTDFRALQFDFPHKNAKLATQSLIPPARDAVKFTDLRPFGDPVFHYASMARAVKVNGRQLDVEGELKPIYVIFDTGSTGMLLTKDLFYPAVNHARITGESYFGDVQVDLETENGNIMTLKAKSPLTTPFDVPWANFKGKGHLVVLGLAFLEKRIMTIDVDDGRIVFDG